MENFKTIYIILNVLSLFITLWVLDKSGRIGEINDLIKTYPIYISFFTIIISWIVRWYYTSQIKNDDLKTQKEKRKPFEFIELFLQIVGFLSIIFIPIKFQFDIRNYKKQIKKENAQKNAQKNWGNVKGIFKRKEKNRQKFVDTVYAAKNKNIEDKRIRSRKRWGDNISSIITRKRKNRKKFIDTVGEAGEAVKSAKRQARFDKAKAHSKTKQGMREISKWKRKNGKTKCHSISLEEYRQSDIPDSVYHAIDMCDKGCLDDNPPNNCPT